MHLKQKNLFPDKSPPESPSLLQVEALRIFPGFDFSQPFLSDVAVVKTKTDIAFTRFARPIKLPGEGVAMEKDKEVRGNFI